MAKPDPKSKDINSIKVGHQETFHVEGENLQNVDYKKGGGSVGKSDVDIDSTVATWDVESGKSQGNDGKKVQIKATVTSLNAAESAQKPNTPDPGGSLGTGDMTITITNSGGEYGKLDTTIDYKP
jgi:hypothetical protein